MGQASKMLLNMLTEFVVCEIKSSAIDGITYTLVISNETSKIERYMQIRKEADKCGFARDQVFRVYEVCNGYVFDMDLGIVKNILNNLIKAVEQTDGVSFNNADIFGDGPEARRKSDMMALARYAKSVYDSGTSKFEVALFNRNKTPRIIISTVVGTVSQKEYIAVKYRAYALRHWDIETVNRELLIPAGIRIYRIEPKEILPTKTGMVFLMNIDSL